MSGCGTPNSVANLQAWSFTSSADNLIGRNGRGASPPCSNGEARVTVGVALGVSRPPGGVHGIRPNDPDLSDPRKCCLSS